MHHYSFFNFSDLNLTLLFVGTLAILSRCQNTGLMTNASLAKYGEYPFVVLLFKNDMEFRAMGSLIAGHYVLSSAYQFVGILEEKLGHGVAGDIELRGRAKSRQLRNIKKCFINPLFYETGYLPDFAVCVLKMERPFALSYTVEPVPLATYLLKNKAQVVGLGLADDHAYVDESGGQLKWNYLTIDSYYCGLPTRLIYCAYSDGIIGFDGDHGSPMIHPETNSVQYGILTKLAIRKPYQSFVALYTDVLLNRDFINHIMEYNESQRISFDWKLLGLLSFWEFFSLILQSLVKRHECKLTRL